MNKPKVLHDAELAMAGGGTTGGDETPEILTPTGKANHQIVMGELTSGNTAYANKERINMYHGLPYNPADFDTDDTRN